MTEFENMNTIITNRKKEFKSTKLLKCLDSTLKVVPCVCTEVKSFEKLIFLGSDNSYGDTFLGIKDTNEIWILFGEKGDEFK